MRLGHPVDLLRNAAVEGSVGSGGQEGLDQAAVAIAGRVEQRRKAETVQRIRPGLEADEKKGRRIVPLLNGRVQGRLT